MTEHDLIERLKHAFEQNPVLELKK
jgi:hypothetical protein